MRRKTLTHLNKKMFKSRSPPPPHNPTLHHHHAPHPPPPPPTPTPPLPKIKWSVINEVLNDVRSIELENIFRKESPRIRCQQITTYSVPEKTSIMQAHTGSVPLQILKQGKNNCNIRSMHHKASLFIIYLGENRITVTLIIIKMQTKCTCVWVKYFHVVTFPVR